MRFLLISLLIASSVFAETHEKQPARATTYIAFGPALLSRMNTEDVAYHFAGAAGWEVGANATLKLAGDLTVGQGALFTSAALAVQAFPFKDDIAPYGEASFGYGYAKTGGSGFFSGEGTGGFYTGLGVGAIFFRTYSVNLDLGLRAGFLLHRNALGHPSLFAFRVGLWF